MSRIEDNVCEKIQQRAAVGKKKYGVTMERGDLNLLEWLQHLQEELMDAAVYVERLMEEVRDGTTAWICPACGWDSGDVHWSLVEECAECGHRVDAE